MESLERVGAGVARGGAGGGGAGCCGVKRWLVWRPRLLRANCRGSPYARVGGMGCFVDGRPYLILGAQVNNLQWVGVDAAEGVAGDGADSR